MIDMTPEQLARTILSKEPSPELLPVVTEVIALRDEAMRIRGEITGGQKARAAVAELLRKSGEALSRHHEIAAVLNSVRDTVLAVDKIAGDPPASGRCSNEGKRE